AGDRAGAAAVPIHVRGRDELALAVERLRAVVDRLSLVARPAVVRELPDLRLRAHVDLLPLALADVADPEVAALPVEGEAPRVPQSVADDLPVAGARRRVA